MPGEVIVEQPRPLNLNVAPSIKARTSSNVDFSTHLRNAMANTTGFASQAAGTAASYIPGGAVLSAALNNAAAQMFSAVGSGQYGDVSMPAGAGITPGAAPGTVPQHGMMQSVADMQQSMLSTNIYMIGVQRQFQQMSEQFSTVSNILKTKHDTQKNSINNIR